jgi:malonate-semialdehyde dehydrogenase (acetylating)/methylmalonate-semialdehyde dehydrogenase
VIRTSSRANASARQGAPVPSSTPPRAAEREVALASAAFVHDVARRAQAAQRGWRDTGLGKRQQVMFRLREIVASRAEELARIITAEHGKTVTTPSARSLEGSRTSSSARV